MTERTQSVLKCLNPTQNCLNSGNSSQGQNVLQAVFNIMNVCKSLQDLGHLLVAILRTKGL